MNITPRDTKLLATLKSVLRHEPPFSEQELETIQALSLQGVGDLSDLQYCTGLRQLSLLACDGGSLVFLSGLESLTHLRITALPVVDVSALASLTSLSVLELLFTFATDISALLEISPLAEAYVVGNPLSDTSYHDVLPKLAERVDDFQSSAEYYWQVCRKIFDAGSGVLIDQYGGPPFLVRPGVPARDGTDCDFIDKVHPGSVSTWMDLLRDQPEQLFEYSIAKRSGVPLPTTFPSHRLVDFGSAKRALHWLELSDAPHDEVELLRELVRRFPRQTFERRRSLDNVESFRQVKLPAWLHAIHRSFGGFRSDEVRTVRFRAFDHSSPLTQKPKEAWYVVGLLGALNQEQRSVIDVSGFFPVARRTSGHSTLAIRLADSEDRCVYEFDTDEVHSQTGLVKPPRVVFDSYVKMLRAIDAVQLDGEVVVEAVDPEASEPPPANPS